MNAYITAIGTAVPPHKIAQADAAGFMAKAHTMDDQEKQRLYALYRASGIKYRHSVIPDYAQDKGYSLFPDNDSMEPFPDINQRMDLYRRHAITLSCQAVQDCLSQMPKSFSTSAITHLVYVSCTGMYAPGVDIELIDKLGLNTHVQRTAINFMGCYAAFNAIKVADSIVRANADANVLIVCTELCTLHFQKTKDEDNLLANALFSDGSASLLISGQKMESVTQLSLEQFYCDLAPEGKQDMAWKIGNFGFEMRLSSYVPAIIKKGIRQLTQNLLSNLALATEEELVLEERLPVDYYAIHPGGKSILKVIEEELFIDKNSNADAYQVLRHFGNMSSPTILFVLKELHKRLTINDNDKSILGLAFGPGLTLESMLLRVSAY